MTNTVDQIVAVICPAFSALATGSKSVYLEDARANTDSIYFGESYNMAVALRACHNFTLDKTRADGTGGSITAKLSGRQAIHFFNQGKKDSKSDLYLTMYGQRLASLLRRPGGAASVGNPDIDPNSDVG